MTFLAKLTSLQSVFRLLGLAFLASLLASVVAHHQDNALQIATQVKTAGAAATQTCPAEEFGFCDSVVVRTSEGFPFVRNAQTGGRELAVGAPANLAKTIYDVAIDALHSPGKLYQHKTGSWAISAQVSAQAGLNDTIFVVAMPLQNAQRPWIAWFLAVLVGWLIANLAPQRGAVGALAGFLTIAGFAGIAVRYDQAILLPVLVCGAIYALARGFGITRQIHRGLFRDRIAYSFVLPTLGAMAILVIVPFTVGIALSFFTHQHGSFYYAGFDNFSAILSGNGRPITEPQNLYFTTVVTILWTAINVFLHVSLGVLLAIALNQTWLRGKGWFRIILIIPWAVPNYITGYIWNGMFTAEYGAINGLLHWFGIAPISWFSQGTTAFLANVCANTWLGFPFMMVVTLGALQTIPKELYEAAAIDGASPWQRFKLVTLPHLRPALGPSIALGGIWTFNMFNIIYLVSRGQPNGASDILVTEAYRWAFERGEQYGMAAAYSTLIFLLLVFASWLLQRQGRRRLA